MEQQSSYTLKSKIKAQIIKQIFKDFGPRYFKGVDQFYLCCKKNQVEMILSSKSKHILITIILKKQLFANYTIETDQIDDQNFTINKFYLEDFIRAGILSQNKKNLLNLDVTPQGLWLIYENLKGSTSFYAKGNYVNNEQKSMIQNLDKITRQEVELQHLQLKFGKVGLFEGVISQAKANCTQSLFFKFDSVHQNLEITNKRDKYNFKTNIRIKELGEQFDKKVEFQLKTLSSSFNLLPNEAELILKMYNKMMLLEAQEKQRCFTIKIYAKNLSSE